MFNIGGGEILVISLIALIVLGPQRLPDAARQVGKAMGELRRLSSGFQNELKGALDDPGPAARPAPRDPLGAGAAPSTSDGPARAALESVSGQPSALPADPKLHAPRRQPLQAAPVNGATGKPAKRTAKGAAKGKRAAAEPGAATPTSKRTPAAKSAGAARSAGKSAGGAKRSSARSSTASRRPRPSR